MELVWVAGAALVALAEGLFGVLGSRQYGFQRDLGYATPVKRNTDSIMLCNEWSGKSFKCVEG